MDAIPPDSWLIVLALQPVPLRHVAFTLVGIAVTVLIDIRAFGT